MKKTNRTSILIFLGLSLLMSTTVFAAKKKTHENIATDQDNGFYISDAAYFKATSGHSKKAVVFVPGFIFNKESWFALAKKLQTQNISSLSVNGKTVAIIKTSIDYLKAKGYEDISLVGGSSGAAAVLATMKDTIPEVTKIVVMSAVRGNPVEAQSTDKLFIVSKDEKSYSKVQGFYMGSAEPKQLKVFPGKSHAQFLFKSEHKDEVTKLILDFIKK